MTIQGNGEKLDFSKVVIPSIINLNIKFMKSEIKEITLQEMVDTDNYSSILTQSDSVRNSVNKTFPHILRVRRLFIELIDSNSLFRLSDNQFIEGFNTLVNTPMVTTERRKVLLKNFKLRSIDFSEILIEEKFINKEEEKKNINLLYDSFSIIYKVRLDGKNVLIQGDVSDEVKAKVLDQASRMNNDVDKSISYSTKSINLDPSKFAYWLFRAILYTRIPPSQRWYYYEDYPEEFEIRMHKALNDFNKAISLVKSKLVHASIYARKAEVFHRMGKNKEAIIEIKRSLNADYKNNTVDNILSIMNLSRENIKANCVT